MKIAIVYTSKTGNTKMLAETIKDSLPQDTCVYCGAPDVKAAQADLIFAGFWTDKGSCDADFASFLENLHHQKLFLFGTAGFGEDATYFSRILANVKTHLDASNDVIDSNMCQGKMPGFVRQRYEAEQKTDMIANFDKALSHPDEKDLANLAQKAKETLIKVK